MPIDIAAQPKAKLHIDIGISIPQMTVVSILAAMACRVGHRRVIHFIQGSSNVSNSAS